MRDLFAATARAFPGSVRAALECRLRSRRTRHLGRAGSKPWRHRRGRQRRAVPRDRPSRDTRRRASASPRSSASARQRHGPLSQLPLQAEHAAAEASGARARLGQTGARPREGSATIGTAVPRGSVPRPPQNDGPIIVPVYYGSYWPWGFGGLGYGATTGALRGLLRSVVRRLTAIRRGGYGYPPSGYAYPGERRASAEDQAARGPGFRRRLLRRHRRRLRRLLSAAATRDRVRIGSKCGRRDTRRSPSTSRSGSTIRRSTKATSADSRNRGCSPTTSRGRS